MTCNDSLQWRVIAGRHCSVQRHCRLQSGLQPAMTSLRQYLHCNDILQWHRHCRLQSGLQPQCHRCSCNDASLQDLCALKRGPGGGVRRASRNRNRSRRAGSFEVELMDRRIAASFEGTRVIRMNWDHSKGLKFPGPKDYRATVPPFELPSPGPSEPCNDASRPAMICHCSCNEGAPAMTPAMPAPQDQPWSCGRVALLPCCRVVARSCGRAAVRPCGGVAVWHCRRVAVWWCRRGVERSDSSTRKSTRRTMCRECAGIGERPTFRVFWWGSAGNVGNVGRVREGSREWMCVECNGMEWSGRGLKGK